MKNITYLKPILVILGIFIIISAGLYFASTPLYKEKTNDSSMPAFSLAPEALAARFEHLSQQRTNSCGGGKDYVAWLSSDGTRIQGSCCSPMIFHSYEEQIEGLKKYADYEIIPPDPYDVPSEWADEMMEYAEQMELTPEQQTVYDNAMEISHEGGPCCCVC